MNCDGYHGASLRQRWPQQRPVSKALPARAHLQGRLDTIQPVGGADKIFKSTIVAEAGNIGRFISHHLVETLILTQSQAMMRVLALIPSGAGRGRPHPGQHPSTACKSSSHRRLRPPRGRPIRHELLERLSGDSPFSFDVTLGIACVATMAFITSLRGSSMVAGNPATPTSWE